MDANSNQEKDLDIEAADIGDIAIDIGDKPTDSKDVKKDAPGSGAKKEAAVFKAPSNSSKSEGEPEEDAS